MVGVGMGDAEPAASIYDLGIKMIFLVSQDLYAVPQAYGQRSPRHPGFDAG
jgi:hypothetical protein